MKNFNLIELAIIHKNFRYFLKDFDSDIQGLKDIQELNFLMGIQSARAAQYVLSNDIEIDNLVSIKQELEDLKEINNLNKTINHLELCLLHKTNIDLLSELIESLEVFLNDIAKLSNEKIFLKRNSNTIDELIFG
jgi:hypothetical protein